MPNEQLREQNIEKVIEAATACFKKYGIEGTKISEIADAAGVSVRSVQRYFGNKDKLVFFMTSYFARQASKDVYQRFSEQTRKEMKGLEKIQVFVGLQEDYFKTNYEILRLLMQAELALYYYSEKSEDGRELFKKYIFELQSGRQKIKEIIEEGIIDGSIRSDVDADVVSSTIGGLVSSFGRRLSTIYKYGEGWKSGPEKEIRCCSEMVIDYLRPR